MSKQDFELQGNTRGANRIGRNKHQQNDNKIELFGVKCGMWVIKSDGDLIIPTLGSNDLAFLCPYFHESKGNKLTKGTSPKALAFYHDQQILIAQYDCLLKVANTMLDKGIDEVIVTGEHEVWQSGNNYAKAVGKGMVSRRMAYVLRLSSKATDSIVEDADFENIIKGLVFEGDLGQL